MRSKCLLLVKIQIQNLGLKKKWGVKQIFLAAIYVMLLVMLASYSFGLAFGLGFLGMEELVPGCAVILPGIVTFFFSMLKTNGILFAYKDYEMLMSLPVPTRTVIASRFLLMYLFHLGMTAFVLVPMGIGYFLWAESSVMAVLIWITGIFLIPLIPTTAATLVGAGIIFISARFRRANAVSTVLTVLLTMSVLIASFGSTAVIPEEGFTPEQIGMIGKALRDSIYQMYPPANWFFRGVTGAGLMVFLSVCCFVSGSVSDFCCACIKKLQKNKYRIDDTSDKGELSSRENYSKTSGDGDLPKGDKAVFWFYHLLCEYGNRCAHESDVGSGVILCVRCRSKADARSADSRTDVEGNPPTDSWGIDHDDMYDKCFPVPGREKSVDSQITSNYEGRNL